MCIKSIVSNLQPLSPDRAWRLICVTSGLIEKTVTAITIRSPDMDKVAYICVFTTIAAVSNLSYPKVGNTLYFG
jgi:hypothetical protein